MCSTKATILQYCNTLQHTATHCNTLQQMNGTCLAGHTWTNTQATTFCTITVDCEARVPPALNPALSSLYDTTTNLTSPEIISQIKTRKLRRNMQSLTRRRTLLSLDPLCLQDTHTHTNLHPSQHAHMHSPTSSPLQRHGSESPTRPAERWGTVLFSGGPMQSGTFVYV
mmetsp:Transcript_55317/g.81280  ORF Transcript_55317/g.81280 Transcript_55317/m.81280 type:complete len:169 (+) Transcript_55317:185-691(+)